MELPKDHKGDFVKQWMFNFYSQKKESFRKTVSIIILTVFICGCSPSNSKKEDQGSSQKGNQESAALWNPVDDAKVMLEGSQYYFKNSTGEEKKAWEEAITASKKALAMAEEAWSKRQTKGLSTSNPLWNEDIMAYGSKCLEQSCCLQKG